MNSNQRIFYYDFLRAFAIFAVILCHVDGIIGYSFWNLKVALPGLLTTIALTGVPIFLMLSGALLLNKEYSLKEFFKKRFSRIIYPFLGHKHFYRNLIFKMDKYRCIKCIFWNHFSYMVHLGINRNIFSYSNNQFFFEGIWFKRS